MRRFVFWRRTRRCPSRLLIDGQPWQCLLTARHYSPRHLSVAGWFDTEGDP